MKKLFSAIACCAIVGATLLTSACSSFMGGGDEAFGIESITPQLIERIEEGEKKYYMQITIAYTDEDVADTVFEIPQGPDGEEGNGIQSIKVVENNTETKLTKLEISYTDPGVDSQFIEVPFGTYVTEAVPVINEETGLTEEVIFYFSNDTLDPLSIKIYHGTDGEDGIDGATWHTGEGDPNIAEEAFGAEGDLYLDTATQDIYKKTGEAWQLLTNIKGEQGEQGKTIVDISCEFNFETNQYDITIVYDDGEKQPISSINNQNAWHVSEVNPTFRDGNVGDFWYNKTAQKIYFKQASGWNLDDPIIDFSIYSTQTHTVTFIYDNNSDTIIELEIAHGSYFALSENKMPTFTRTGYVFKGWFTSDDPNDVNSGQLTDLTPIMGDLTVYARWEALPTQN